MRFVDITDSQEMAKKEERGFGERVLSVLEQQKKSKSWLAEEIGVSKQGMNYLLKHSSNPKYVTEIAVALEIRPEWLLLGTGNRQNVSEEPNDIARIPILPLTHVPLFTQKDSYSLTDEFTHITSNSTSSCFGIFLENSCMEPLFQKGTLLLFNALGKPKNGDYVIFALAKKNEVLFRQYFRDGETTYLKAVNTFYESYKCSHAPTLFGVLVESRNHFK